MTDHYSQVLVVTEPFNMAVNYFDAKQSTHYSRVLVVTELVLSGAVVHWVLFSTSLVTTTTRLERADIDNFSQKRRLLILSMFEKFGYDEHCL